MFMFFLLICYMFYNTKSYFRNFSIFLDFSRKFDNHKNFS